MSVPLSIAEQIALLHAETDVATFALQHLGLPGEWRDTSQPGNTERCQDAVDQVFTLTRADIEAHLAAEGLAPEPFAHVQTKAGSRDAWYLIEREGEWDFYWQERGFPNFLWTFDDLAEARKAVINHLIPVWLERLHVPCRTKDGVVCVVP